MSTVIPVKKVRNWLAEVREVLPGNPESAVIGGDRVFFSYHSGHHLPPRHAEYARLSGSAPDNGSMTPIQLEIAPGVLAAVNQVRVYRDPKLAVVA